MPRIPQHIPEKLAALAEQEAVRQLRFPGADQVDFTSNDYLGLRQLTFPSAGASGSGGSRLLSGHSHELLDLERYCSRYFRGESALVFTSGYMANLGVLGAIADRHSTFVYDALIHASMREGLRLSPAKSFAFRHQDFADLDQKLSRCSGTTFVLVESLYSMDGDLLDVEALLKVTRKHDAFVILDEAHSTGLYGDAGAGWSIAQGYQDDFLVRIHTFGKAIGRHGAVVIAPEEVRQYLVNRARPLIYSTAMAPAQAVELCYALDKVAEMDAERASLLTKRATLEQLLQGTGLDFGTGQSPILPVIVPGNIQVKAAANFLQEAGFDVRPILAPTVAPGAERLRIILHSYNTMAEIEALAQALRQWQQAAYSCSAVGASPSPTTSLTNR